MKKVTKKDLIQLADILLDVEKLRRVNGYWTGKYSFDGHPQKELEYAIFHENPFGWSNESSDKKCCEIIQNVASLLYSEAQVNEWLSS